MKYKDINILNTRKDLLKSIYPSFCKFCYGHNLQPEKMSEVLSSLWLPLAIKIASQQQKLKRPFIQGILGGQGTGKTTLCKALCLILQHLGHNAISLSIDDLYKTYSDRLILQQQDPRLIWRGPPGTHDVNLGLTVLDQVLIGQTVVKIPRFDKSACEGAGDRTTPEIITNVDILLFEGWFVGVRPIQDQEFDNPPWPILTLEDKIFARDINQNLHDYLPLWERLDSLIVLYPTDYRLSLQWRQQAEHEMIASGKSGMSDSQIEEFVKYFWRSLHPELFITPLVESSGVDLVIQINSDRSFKCSGLFK